MKKVILTTAALVLVGGGAAYAAIGGNSDKTNTVDNSVENTHEKVKVEHVSTNDFPEIEAISEVVDVDKPNAEAVEDNNHKRVIVFKDDNGHPIAKSIFIKNDSRLKVIDFDKGKVFDDVIKETADNAKTDHVSKENEDNHKAEEHKDNGKNTSTEETSNIEDIVEYKTIGDHVDVDKYDVKVVEDNTNKRIILLSDGHSKPAYKTIYIKNKNMLKIIDLNGGLVYNGTI